MSVVVVVVEDIDRVNGRVGDGGSIGMSVVVVLDSEAAEIWH